MLYSLATDGVAKITPSFHKEADTHFFLHVADSMQNVMVCVMVLVLI